MTTNYTDAELEVMLRDLESDLVERKESFRPVAERVREAVCAFANDLPDHRTDGVVFIGARDDGTAAHLPITDELLLQIADIKTDGNIVPPPTLTLSKRLLAGAEMAVVTVEPADSPPVRFRGRVHIRIGPRRGIASAQDERILNGKRRYRDKPYDIHPVFGATIVNLNRAFFEYTYLPAAVAPDVLAEHERSYEQRLAALKLVVSIDDPTPTVLGNLILGTRTRDFMPAAYIQFLRVAGTSLIDPIVDEALIDGTVPESIRRLDDKLISHNRTSVDITGGPIEKRRSLYPQVALEQLTRNAVLHRTYEATNAPVRVTWFDDRIDIISPGGPYGTVSAENFGEPGVTDYRNPNLAEAMRVLGLVQRFGAGIVIARQALARNGNPPVEFDVLSGFVIATLRPAF